MTSSVDIICGDSLPLLKSMNKGDIKYFITSPPYNLLNSSGNGNKWVNNKVYKSMVDGYDLHDDNMPHHKYVEWQREYISEMLRIIPDDGAIYYNHKWRIQNGLLQDRSDIMDGFPVRQIIIWHRAGGFNHNPGYYLPTYEVIYLLPGKKFRLLPKASGIGDVWYIPQSSKSSHPCPFPVELVIKILKSIPGGKVCDPFAGEGTTGSATKKLNFGDCLLLEKSQKYCQLARELINNTNTPLF